MASDLAPIVLFVYNRPDHTRRTLAALAADPLAVDSDLIIYADGPKKPEHAESVKAVRNFVRTVSGFKSVNVIERESNLGLAKSIITGVSDICERYGRVIVVEDDLIVGPQFLTFLNRGLERYADEPKVYQISGYMFPVPEPATSQAAAFLPLISCWGWATWQRAWVQFDPAASDFQKLERDPGLRHRFNLEGHYDYFGMLKDQIEGKIDSWGVRWLFSVFLKQGLVLYPTRSLVENVGIDGSGTHGAGTANLQIPLNNDVDASFFLKNLPSDIRNDVDVLDQVKQLLSSSRAQPFITRVIRKIFK